MPAKDLSRWIQNKDGSWRVKTYAETQTDSAPAPTSSDDGTAGAEYSEMTLVQLREELISRGLSKYGNKPELIERLQESDAA